MTVKFYKNTAHLPTHPGRVPLRGGKVGTAAIVHEVIKAEDGVLGHGARILATVGLAGQSAFMADASVDPEEGTQTHPRYDVWRVVARSKVLLAPGYAVRFRATCTKSGIQQKPMFGDWPYVGAGGALRCEVTYDNGVDTLTQTRVMTPLASPNFNGAEGTDPGAAFLDLHTQDFEVYPPLILFDAVVARRWSESTTVEIVVSYKGSPRVVDLCVYEAPVPYSRNTATDAASTYTIPLHTDGTGKALAAYPSPWPITVRSEAVGGDPSGGAVMALAVAVRQAQRIGPVAMYWTSFREDLTPASTEAAEVTVTSTSGYELRAVHTTAHAAPGPGHAFGVPGFARPADLAGPLELRGVVAVLPVRVRIYARTSNTDNPGTVRVVLAGYSVAEINVTAASWGWVEQWGWLKCGLNGDDPQSLQIFPQGGGDGETVEVRYAVVEFMRPML